MRKRCKCLCRTSHWSRSEAWCQKQQEKDPAATSEEQTRPDQTQSSSIQSSPFAPFPFRYVALRIACILLLLPHKLFLTNEIVISSKKLSCLLFFNPIFRSCMLFLLGHTFRMLFCTIFSIHAQISFNRKKITKVRILPLNDTVGKSLSLNFTHQFIKSSWFGNPGWFECLSTALGTKSMIQPLSIFREWSSPTRMY